MAFKIDNFGADSTNAKGTLGGICYYRYRNEEGDDITAAGYFPALLGLQVGDRIIVIPQDLTTSDEVYAVTSIANRTVEVEEISSGGSAVIEELNVTPSTSAQTITASAGVDGYSPVQVAAVDSSIDPNILSNNIIQGVTILGISGSAVELNGETKTVTPQTYGQTIYPTSPKNGITEITVNAVTSSIDTNITAGNIKKDVQILGVTGTYEGGGSSGLAIELENSSGVLQPKASVSQLIDLSGVDTINQYALAGAYYGNTSLQSVDLSNIVTLRKGALCYAFALSSITDAVIGVRNIPAAASNGKDVLSYTFANCNNLVSVILPYLITIGNGSGTAGYSTEYMFVNCTSLAEVRFDSLSDLGSYGLQRAFSGCTNINVYFPNLSVLQSNALRNSSDSGTHGIRYHFPANMQSTVEAQSGYSATAPFGAADGSVLFDLPSTYTLTGANSEMYRRFPLRDAAGALAWYDTTDVFGPSTIPYYTSGTTDPSVNDTIYSDDACTIAVTTISSIS